MAFPIVGADFLNNFDLMVDLKRLRLVTQAGRVYKLQAPASSSSFATIGVRPAMDSVRPLAHSLDRSRQVAGVNEPSGSLAAPVTRDLSAGANLVDRSAATVDYVDLLQQFNSVVNPSKKLPKVKHKVEHFIETEGRPVRSKYRRLDPEKLEAAKAEFLDLEKQGIVRRSDSSWASPLHMVRKADGTWRPCGDFRRLNLQTRPDLYTCPNIGDLTARLAGSRVFSKLDLRKGYHQVPVRPEDVAKTAIITPFGLFEYLRMPFGLRNAGQTFQRMMDSIMSGLTCCFIYLDDVLVASPNHQQHSKDLEAVLQRLEEHGLVLNVEKCQWGVTELDYLGHHVTASGISPIKDRVTAIEKFPQPKTVKQLQTYLGMVNFYRRFLRGAARVLKPLTDSLQGKPKGDIKWTPDMEEAFISSKAALYNSVELAHPDSQAQLSLAVDASESHVGAVLQQQTRGGCRPLAFFSVKLDNAQKKYSAFDRELLAVYMAIRHFRWVLEGRTFHVWSDHKPLSYALHGLTDARTARQQRQLSFVAEFTSDIRHIAGKENVVADALSRPAAAVGTPSTCHLRYTQGQPPAAQAGGDQTPSTCHLRHTQGQPPAAQAGGTWTPSTCHLRHTQGRPPAAPEERATTAAIALPSTARIDFKALAEGQATCLQTQQLKESGTLAIERVEIEHVAMWCDVSTGVMRPLVPEQLRRQVFEAVHGLSHPGIRATRRMVSSRFTWQGCASDVTAWCRECQGCATGKVTIQEKTKNEPIEIPVKKFQHVHADLVGPLPTSEEGYTYLLTVIDRTSRWPEAIPLKTISAQDVADNFITGWVARFGVPRVVTTDRGTQFTSAIWECMCRTLGVQHVVTTAYHPQSNGMVERLHRQVKQSLRARNCGNSWANHLPWVLLGIRAAPKEDSSVSAAEVVYGETLTLPGQLHDLAGQSVVQQEQETPLIPLRDRNYRELARNSVLEGVEFVYVRRGPVGAPFSQSYSGPYRILSKNRKSYQLQIGARTEWVSADRLKPHRGAAPEPAQPPRRGRPPGAGGQK